MTIELALLGMPILCGLRSGAPPGVPPLEEPPLQRLVETEPSAMGRRAMMIGSTPCERLVRFYVRVNDDVVHVQPTDRSASPAWFPRDALLSTAVKPTRARQLLGRGGCSFMKASRSRARAQALEGEDLRGEAGLGGVGRVGGVR